MSTSNRNLAIAVGAVVVVLVLLCVCLVGAFMSIRGGSINAFQGSAATATPLIVTRVAGQRATATPQQNESAPAAPQATATPLPPLQLPPGGDVETQILTSLYERVNPSVVNITILGRAGDQTIPGLPIPTPSNPDELVPVGQGSGFVWDADGHIVTNAHVVVNSDQVQVTFSDGTTAPAAVIGSDPDSDLAVVKVDPTHANLVPVARGNMADVKVGQRVAAIGNPFGYANTLTAGIVSAIGRSITSLTDFNIPSVIQTDAAINPGNSGGPLLNAQGEVIGVNAQIETANGVRANSGVGFAIPISIVDRVVPSLIQTGVYRHSYLGITGNTYSPFCAEALGLSPDVRGAYVQQVAAGGPADKGGIVGGSRSTNLQACPSQAGGDLIVAINDKPVTKFDDLLDYLENNTSPGDTVTLTVLRDGKQTNVPVELGRRPTRSQ